MMESGRIRHYLVIGAASFIFLIFGVWELINPQYWVGFVPQFLLTFYPTILVIIHGIVLTFLGIWIATGKWLRIAAIVGTLVMAQIVISLLVLSGFSDLLVRDVTILLFILSLVFEGDAPAR